MTELTYTEIDIKASVSNGALATFQFYRGQELWYATEQGQLFSVPISDVGESTFNKEEKALLLMRYMRKWNKKLGETKDVD